MLKSKSTYKYLDFVKFSQLYNWSVQYLNDSKIRFTTKYPLVQIKKFLTRNKTAIEIQDDVYYNKSVDKYINLTNRLLRRFYRGFSNDLENVRNSLLCVIILSNNPCQKQR